MGGGGGLVSMIDMEDSLGRYLNRCFVGGWGVEMVFLDLRGEGGGVFHFIFVISCLYYYYLLAQREREKGGDLVCVDFLSFIWFLCG